MEMTETLPKKRIAYIDVAKGIGILLMILGHTMTSGWGKDVIYSFHMPLFFRVFGNDLSSFGIGRPMAPAGGAICPTAAVASGALVCGTERNLWCGRRMFREWESVPGVFVDTFIDFVLGKWR